MRPKTSFSAGFVLILEQDIRLADRMVETLSDEGFTVCGVAGTAEAAIALFERYRPEFALIEARLQRGDGREVVRAIASASPLTAIVVCAAGDSRDLTGLGAHVILDKPFDLASLGPALEAASLRARGEAPDDARAEIPPRRP